MIKKKTALLFILLANIVILVHAVAPHHHHYNQVCIDNIHCQNDFDAPKHSTSEHNHHPDGSEETDDCALKQAVVIPANSFKQALKCPHTDDHSASFIGYQSVLPDNSLKFAEPIIVSSVQKSLLTFLPSDNNSAALGLRAPPAV
jgi:hypothetical protein